MGIKKRKRHPFKNAEFRKINEESFRNFIGNMNRNDGEIKRLREENAQLLADMKKLQRDKELSDAAYHEVSEKAKANFAVMKTERLQKYIAVVLAVIGWTLLFYK